MLWKRCGKLSQQLGPEFLGLQKTAEVKKQKCTKQELQGVQLGAQTQRRTAEQDLLGTGQKMKTWLWGRKKSSDYPLSAGERPPNE